MTLTIGDTAPDFEAETTEGKISFHDWIGDSWAVLFSHPKDFTPVCTTELGYMASIKPEFERRNVKVIGLSVDSTSDHEGWARDIEETQGTAPNYPIIGDADFEISKRYGMLGADVSGDPKDRTAADNQTVRNVFVIGPDKKVKLVLVYPMTTGRNFDEVLRVIDSLQLTGAPPRLDARQLEGRRRRDHRRLRLERRGEADLAGRLGGAQAVHPDRPAAALNFPQGGIPQERNPAAGSPPAAGHIPEGVAFGAATARVPSAPDALVRVHCSANQSARRPVSPGVSTRRNPREDDVHGASKPAGNHDRGGCRRDRARPRAHGRRRRGRRARPGDHDRPDRNDERAVRGPRHRPATSPPRAVSSRRRRARTARAPGSTGR